MIINVGKSSTAKALGLKLKNPWGAPGFPDLQRSDLWVIDLSAVHRAVGTAVLWQDHATISALANQVTLPTKKIESKTIRRNNVPVAMPDYDAAVDACRISFYVDNDANHAASAIYTLLNSWFELARYGRGYLKNAPNIQYNGSASDIPAFRFDINVYALRGLTAREAAADDVDVLKVSQGYKLTNAWLSSIHLDDFDYKSGNRVSTVSAELIPEDITPI